jgi:predicted lipoprotein with Yx(FWY)xxD motif
MSGLIRTTCAATVAAVTAIGGVALATGGTPTVRAAHNAALGRTIVVDGNGRTLYALRPETARHLLCKSSACLAAWPRLTVRAHHGKLTAGPGVTGRLATLRRSDGKLQVTLRGMPLYRFAGDSARGQAHGAGIKSFGGTWHAVAPKATTTTPTPSPSPDPAPPTGYGGYGGY